jgi:hypothetical protein
MRRLCFALLLLAGCGSPTEPFVRRRAWLGAPPVAIVVADTVRAGTPFGITVFAAGSGTIDCNRPDGAEVSYAAGVARVEIFIRVRKGALVCTDDLRYYPIPVTLTFGTPGNGRIRVIGSAGSEGSQLDSLERTVVVR